MYSLHVNVPTCTVLYCLCVHSCPQLSSLMVTAANRFCHPASLIHNFCDCILCDSEDKHVPFQVHVMYFVVVHMYMYIHTHQRQQNNCY